MASFFKKGCCECPPAGMSNDPCKNFLTVDVSFSGGGILTHTPVYKNTNQGRYTLDPEYTTSYNIGYYIWIEQPWDELKLYAYWRGEVPEDNNIQIKITACDKTMYCTTSATMVYDGYDDDSVIGDHIGSVILQPDGSWSLECVNHGLDCREDLSFMAEPPGDIIDVEVVYEYTEVAPMDPDDPRFLKVIATETEYILGYYVHENIGTVASPRRGDFIEYRDYTWGETETTVYNYEAKRSGGYLDRYNPCFYYSDQINFDFVEIIYYPDMFAWMFKATPIYNGNYKAVPGGNGIFYDHWLGGEFTRVFEYNPVAENIDDYMEIYKYTLTVKPR